MLDTEEKYGGSRHTKSYPKCKLLPEFDDEALEPIQPKNKMVDQPDPPARGRDRAANDVTHKPAHDLHEDLHQNAIWPGPSTNPGSALRHRIMAAQMTILTE